MTVYFILYIQFTEPLAVRNRITKIQNGERVYLAISSLIFQKTKKANINKVERWSLIIGLIVIAVASVVAWVFSPKGENQTYVFLPLLMHFLALCLCLTGILGFGGVR